MGSILTDYLWYYRQESESQNGICEAHETVYSSRRRCVVYPKVSMRGNTRRAGLSGEMIHTEDKDTAYKTTFLSL
jgi:hypothetical protein